MGIFDFLTGEFVDVIHHTDDTRDTIVWRFEREGHEIKYGAKLTVREGQAAVFVHEGQIADVFAPGMYMLETNNMPVLTKLNHWDHGFQSPFKSEIYFVNTTRFTDLKWGTKNPIMCRDPEFGPVRLRAFGTYEIKVSDPALFMREIVGTDGEFTTDEISYTIRNLVVTQFTTVIAQSGIPVLDMAANQAELGKLLRDRIAPMLAEYGIELVAFYIENISLPPEVERVLDQRTSMGVAGDLGRYMQFQTAQALGQETTGGALSSTMGMGLGLGIGAQAAPALLAQTGPWGGDAHPAKQLPASPGVGVNAASPLVVERLWHLALGNETSGPYSKARLGRMAQAGEITRETLAWTEGQDGWKQAGTLDELARLFTVSPPPLPKA